MREDREKTEGANVLEGRRRSDASVVQVADERRHREAEKEPVEENRLTAEAVELDRVEDRDHS